MFRRLLRINSWLGFSLAVCSAPVFAQTAAPPVRSITLPPACQHLSRELYVYGSGERLGLRNKSVFYSIDVANGRVKQFRGLGEIISVTPARKGFLVAMVAGFYHLTVLDDQGQSQFDGDLDSSGVPAIHWNSDESHVVVFSFPDESDEADTATIVNIPKRTIKSLDLNPTATVRFDAGTDTLSATQEQGKVSKLTVYDLEGKVLRHGVGQKIERQHVDSASHKYSYFPKGEIGEGDTLIRQASGGGAVLRLREYKNVGSRGLVLWDNPRWNPVEDDLLLLLYLPVGLGEGRDFTEVDVLSVSKGKAIRVFALSQKVIPAYGWTADGKQLVLCDVDCSFYPVP